MLQAKNYHFRFAIAVIGDEKVGKSAFLTNIEQVCQKIEHEESNNYSITTFLYKDDQTVYQIIVHTLPKMNNSRQVQYYTNCCEIEVFLFDALRKSSLD